MEHLECLCITKMSTDDLRRALNGLLNDAGDPSVTEPEWSVLVSREYPRHFADGEPEALTDAFAFLEDVRRARGDARARQQRPPDEGMKWHDWALSDLFAAHAIQQDAEHHFGIAAFREKALSGKLLQAKDAGPWVVERSKKEGKPTTVKTKTKYGVSERLELLAYGIEGDEWTHRLPVRHGGLLDELRKASKKLEDFYGWGAAQASFFILTGAVPYVSSIRSTVQWVSPLAARQRITLSLHPTCTPREVVRAYGEIRRHNYGRLRRLSPRHSMLAAFYAELPDGLPPSEMLRRWNEHCAAKEWPKKWQYKKADADLFNRDARTAVYRLAELGGQKMASFLPPGIGLRVQKPKAKDGKTTTE